MSRESSQKAIVNFYNFKNVIINLYIILKRIASKENDIFIRLGMVNIEGVSQNILELIFNDYGLKKLVRKLEISENSLVHPLEGPLIS